MLVTHCVLYRLANSTESFMMSLTSNGGVKPNIFIQSWICISVSSSIQTNIGLFFPPFIRHLWKSVKQNLAASASLFSHGVKLWFLLPLRIFRNASVSHNAPACVFFLAGGQDQLRRIIMGLGLSRLRRRDDNYSGCPVISAGIGVSVKRRHSEMGGNAAVSGVYTCDVLL